MQLGISPSDAAGRPATFWEQIFPVRSVRASPRDASPWRPFAHEGKAPNRRRRLLAACAAGAFLALLVLLLGAADLGEVQRQLSGIFQGARSRGEVRPGDDTLQEFCGSTAWWQGRGANATFLQPCQAREPVLQPRTQGYLSRDECGPVVGMPKVALLFLTRGPMTHENLWSRWFEQAAGLVRADCLGAALCEARAAPGGAAATVESLGGACSGRERHGPDAVARQSLFNVYVHANPDFQGYGPKSPFHGRIIPDELRMQTGWGEHSTTEVVRRMLRLALQEPLNQRFLLVSEACVPMYPPTVLYASLMADDKSRINACRLPGWHRQAERWSNRMAQGGLTKRHWRKHWQWFEIMRSHAQLVADDEHVSMIYAQHCTNAWDPDQNRHRMCFSDEHYMSALLAFKGVERETDCAGVITWADWAHGEIIHPKTYRPPELSPQLLNDLRASEGKCDALSAIHAAGTMFATVADVKAGSCSRLAQRPFSRPDGLVPYHCPMLARKFKEDISQPLLELFEKDKELGLLDTGSGACSALTLNSSGT